MATMSDMISGILNRLVAAESFDDISWILGETIVTAVQKQADALLESNVEFQSDSGLTPVIRRIPLGECCDFCAELAGTYEYPAPDEVYQRHQNCQCLVVYETVRTGTSQNVWSKKTYENEAVAIKSAMAEYKLTEEDVYETYKKMKKV